MAKTTPITFAFKIPNQQGGDPFLVQGTVGAGGVITLNNVAVPGIGLTTAGVADSTDKRFVTDAELASLVTLSSLLTETLLSSTPTVNLNTASPTTLYTVPTGKTCVITKVVLRGASISLTTASISFGFTSAAFNDVIATATHTELTGATLYTILLPKIGAKLGVAAAVFSVLCNILQGAAATITIDVYGYLF